MKKFLFLFCLLPILAWTQSQIDQFQVLQLGYNASPGNPPSFTGYVYINNSGQLVCTLHNGTSCLSGGGGGTGTIIASPSPDCLPYYQGANTTLTADCALVTDTAGGLTLVKLTVSGVSTGVITLKTGSAPANPASGNGSLYIDSITQNLTCINSSGGTCMPAAASPGGSSTQFQFNNGLGGFGGSAGFTWNNSDSTITFPDGTTWDIFGDVTFPTLYLSTNNDIVLTTNSGPGAFMGMSSIDGHFTIVGAGGVLLGNLGSPVAGEVTTHTPTQSSNDDQLSTTSFVHSAVSAVTTPNCAATGTAASPSVVSCTAAVAGAFSCATNSSAGTCRVNTTAVTANSEIFVTINSSEGTRLSVTCATSANITVLPTVLLASKSAGVSFTINTPTFTVNPVCFDYMLVN